MLRARKHQISAGLEAICKQFPKLKCGNGKLSLLNSATYGIKICPEKGLESEEESELESKEDKERERPSKHPTKEMVFNCFTSLGAPEETDHFYDHYEANGWMVGKVNMSNWPAACRSWLKSPYREKNKKKSNLRTEKDMRESAEEITREIQSWSKKSNLLA